MTQSAQDSHDRKLKVGILFGGKSAEHEVSIESAKNVIQALDADAFEPVLIGIDKSGKWHLDATHMLTGGSASPSSNQPPSTESMTLLPGGTDGRLIGEDGQNSHQLDVIFPVLHGPKGEDGAIQGFLELANLPYVGPGILGSAVGMDKDVMKRLLRDAGIRVTDFITVTARDLSTLQPGEVIEKFGLPLFVKPANMGSSVGVTKVESTDGLLQALRLALQFDTKALIEKAVVGDEIECAVLGNDDPKASIVGRIIPTKEDFYSYEAKYVDENGAMLEIPANIPDDVAQRAQAVAIQTFKALGCEGMSRVDMFACGDGSVVVNEINTIPGFTKISMYPKLWEASGVSYTNLITQLLHLAIERFTQRQRLQTTYKSLND